MRTREESIEFWKNNNISHEPTDEQICKDFSNLFFINLSYKNKEEFDKQKNFIVEILQSVGQQFSKYIPKKYWDEPSRILQEFETNKQRIIMRTREESIEFWSNDTINKYIESREESLNEYKNIFGDTEENVKKFEDLNRKEVSFYDLLICVAKQFKKYEQTISVLEKVSDGYFSDAYLDDLQNIIQTPKQREPGFYWVKLRGSNAREDKSWEPAEFISDDIWKIIDSSLSFEEYNIAEIGDKINKLE